MIKKILAWLVIIFLIFWISSSPDPAAKFFRALFFIIVDIFTGFGKFFGYLVN